MRPVLSLRGTFFVTKQPPAVLTGDCFGKKRLAMTRFGIFGQTLLNQKEYDSEFFFIRMYK